jgi:DNA primase
MRQAIALLLDDPSLAERVRGQPEHWRELDNPGVGLLGELLERIGQQPDISSAALREHWRETDSEPIVARLSNSALLAHIPPEGRGEELSDALKRLNREGLAALRQRLLAKADNEGLTADERDQLRRIARPPT